MSWWTHLRTQVGGWIAGGGLSQQSGEQITGPGSYSAASPSAVSLDSAMQVSTVWGCTKLLADTISTLPCYLYEKSGKRLVPAEDESLYQVLALRANRHMDAPTYIGCGVVNRVLQGNEYSLIERNVKGDVVDLYPLAAHQVRVALSPDGELRYVYFYDGKFEVFPQEKIFHVQGMGNGIVGLSALSYARNAIGAAQAAEQYGSDFYVNGAKAGGLLMVDKVLTDDQRAALRRNFDEISNGPRKRLFVLEANMKYEQVQISPEDAQMLQTRNFQVEDLCRYFGVPPVMVGHTDKTTTWGTGIEQIKLGFYTFGVRPLLNRFEWAVKTQLIPIEKRRKFDVEFDFTDLLRADSGARSTFYSQMVNNGLMTRNEAREMEKLPPIEGAGNLTVQGALVNIEDTGKRMVPQRRESDATAT